MKRVNNNRNRTEYELEVGDTICVAGIKATIATITEGSQYFDYEEGVNERNGYFALEFRDTNGIYRSYKQRFDGGYVISKEE